MEVRKNEQVINVLDFFNKRHKLFAQSILKKIDQIVDNPYHFKPLRNKLKNYRRAHIGHYVIIYRIENNCIYFEAIVHHDNAY